MTHRMALELNSLSALGTRFQVSPQKILAMAKELILEPSAWIDGACYFSEVDAERIGQELQARRMSKAPTSDDLKMTARRSGERMTRKSDGERL